jgi:hypothetical protein
VQAHMNEKEEEEKKDLGAALRKKSLIFAASSA